MTSSISSKSRKRPWVVSSFDDDLQPSSGSSDTPQHENFSADSSVFSANSSGSDRFLNSRSSRKTNQRSGHVSKSLQPSVLSKSSVKRSARDDLWCDNTLSRDELAVHPKKVLEVEEWLINAFTGVKGHRVLLLTGPAGAGKTACVRALVAEMGLNIKEWINATSTACYAPDKLEWSAGGDGWMPGDSVPEQGQVAQFREFATRANKYGSVAAEPGDMGRAAAGSLVLVEDLPNAFYRDPEQFHDILRRYTLSGCSPAVFVLSDSPQLEHSAKNLFPPHLCQSAGITTIQFNPVAPGLLTKALTRLSTKQRLAASQDLVTSLAVAAAGDIRTAVNALQFCSARPDVDPTDALSVLTRKSSSKGRGRGKGKAKAGAKEKAGQAGAPPEDTLPAVGGRDASLLMFRALGKVLYCKRSDEPAPPLPPHLRKEERAPALECPEAVLDRCCLAPATFVAFLHQNYHTFVPSIEAAGSAVQYLADTDIIMGQWADRDALSCYSTIGVRGMMHSTGSAASSSSSKKTPSFKPLTAPAFTDVSRTATRRRDELRTHYRDQGMHELTTLLVPYVAKVHRHQYTPASAIVREVGTMVESDFTQMKKRQPPPAPAPVTVEDEENLLDYDDHIEEVDD